MRRETPLHAQCANGKLIFQFYALKLQPSYLLPQAENYGTFVPKTALIQATAFLKLPGKERKNKIKMGSGIANSNEEISGREGSREIKSHSGDSYTLLVGLRNGAATSENNSIS